MQRTSGPSGFECMRLHPAPRGQTGVTVPPAVKSSVFPNFRKIDTLLQAGIQCAPLQRLRATLANFQDLPEGYVCALGESRALPRQCKNGSLQEIA